MTTQNELHIIYSHRSPVSISGEDPVSLLIYLNTPTAMRYSEFKRAVVTDLEETIAA